MPNCSFYYSKCLGSSRVLALLSEQPPSRAAGCCQRPSGPCPGRPRPQALVCSGAVRLDSRKLLRLLLLYILCCSTLG